MQTTEFPSNISSQKTDTPKLSASVVNSGRQNKQIVHEQVQKLTRLNLKINSISVQVSKNKKKCEETIQHLKEEVASLALKIKGHQTQANGPAVEEEHRRRSKDLEGQYVSLCKQRIKIANSIDIKALKKIQIEDKKSPANQIFKWILFAIYNQAGNKFFWPNFMSEALENDKGRDFIERMGKVPSSSARDQQKIKTDQFLTNYQTYAAAQQIKDVQPEMEKIRQIAELFKKGYLVWEQIKNIQKSIQRHKEQTLDKDEEFTRWVARSEALKDRIQINQSYLTMLMTIERQIEPKLKTYQQMATKGSKLELDLNVGQWNSCLGATEHKGCECSLF